MATSRARQAAFKQRQRAEGKKMLTAWVTPEQVEAIRAYLATGETLPVTAKLAAPEPEPERAYQLRISDSGPDGVPATAVFVDGKEVAHLWTLGSGIPHPWRGQAIGHPGQVAKGLSCAEVLRRLEEMGLMNEEQMMVSTPITRLRTHVEDIGRRQQALSAEAEAIRDRIRTLGLDYESAVLSGNGIDKVQTELEDLERKAASLDKQALILGRSDRSEQMATLAQAVVDDARERAKVLQAHYDRQAAAVTAACDAYLAAIAELGTIARQGAVCGAEAREACDFLPNRVFVGLREVIAEGGAGDDLALPKERILNIYRGLQR